MFIRVESEGDSDERKMLHRRVTQEDAISILDKRRRADAPRSDRGELGQFHADSGIPLNEPKSLQLAGKLAKRFKLKPIATCFPLLFAIQKIKARSEVHYRLYRQV